MEVLALERNPSVVPALERGARALVDMQGHDGSWEGECVWCPMLTAQYAIAAEIMGLAIPEARRSGMLAHFRRTQSHQGGWGLHPEGDASLFVTALVYVAARFLGARPEESWLRRARRIFEHDGGVQAIPTWGKVWLALVGLYEWEGVNPILPEAWVMPSWVPLHPSNYYCHTRSIYLGLAVLYGQRFVAPHTPLTDELRQELYVQAYDTIDFRACANRVRQAEAPFRVTRALHVIYGMSRLYERVRSRRLREGILDALREQMRQDLRASSHLSLSPVNGLLTMLALWADDPSDRELRRAVNRFEDWFWEDPAEGSRVAGAGSICWDSAFALQALAALPRERRIDASIGKGASFLASQQLLVAEFDFEGAGRIDPAGGWCFSEADHGWPVSDCTAEALLALLRTRPEALGRERAARAARFILRCQNRDGGFGSYEPRKTRFSLEWMNPAEMFGRCMTERSYVECTASCLMALQEVRARYPDALGSEIVRAIDRAHAFLEAAQSPEGAWEAAWGVRYIYATMFGVRGLLAAGVPRSDSSIRKACDWLLRRQRADGGWGENQSAGSDYLDAGSSRVVQTAWVLITLVEAHASDRDAMDRAARFLESTQLESGEWPDGEFVGVFFKTALLSYRLYRQYFPVTALALYERDAAGRPPRGNSHASTEP